MHGLVRSRIFLMNWDLPRLTLYVSSLIGALKKYIRCFFAANETSLLVEVAEYTSYVRLRPA